MSGIFGVARLAGGAPDPKVALALSAAMTPWGRDRVERIEAPSAVLGHALTTETPEDRFTVSPAADASLAIVAEGRLDDRSAVARSLGIGAEDALAMADSTLIAHAYRRWGSDCATRLIGEWSMAAWHPVERRLVLARDHAGNTSLYVWLDAARGVVAFASGMRPMLAALAAAGVRPRPDEHRLAAMLVSWPELDVDRTYLAEVVRVPPGHVAEVTPAGIRQRRFWFPEQVPEARGMTLGEAAEGVLAVLDRAVRDQCRTVGGVASMLSGGLDSGSVTALATRALHDDGRTLTAFSSVPASAVDGKVDPAMFGDEAALASSTAAMAGVDRHVLVDGSRVSPMQGVERVLDALGTPTHAVSNAFWMQETFDRMRDRETAAGTLLTGHAGNGTVSWTGRERRTSLAGRIAELLPVGVQRWRTAQVLATAGWPNSAIAPQFAARLDLARRSGDSVGRDGGPPRAGADALRQRLAIYAPGAARIGDMYSGYAAHAGIDVRDPTADPRVAEFCFAIPDRLYRGPDGTDRQVMRVAMAGVLPDGVRLNPLLGWQSADLVARLRATRDEVEAALAEAADGPAAEYVSLDAMRRAWAEAQVADDHRTTHRAGALLLRGLCASLWVNRTFE